MNRFWPHFLIAAGLVLVVAGFIYNVLFAGIPYQDPTPEMSANYDRHAHIASAICWCGFVFFLLGSFVGIGRWAIRRGRSSNAS